MEAANAVELQYVDCSDNTNSISVKCLHEARWKALLWPIVAPIEYVVSAP